MIHDKHFYNGTLRKTVAAFGSLFNNIKIVRQLGQNRVSVERVPLMVANRSKLLARVKEQPQGEGADKISVKLPRMSFEIVSLSYNPQMQMQKINKRITAGGGAVFQSVPYLLSIQLNIVSNTTDESMQIVEQILPTFTPDYVISIKDIEGEGATTDVPIQLEGVSLTDDYEGMFDTRRIILWTLDFQVKIRFAGPTLEYNPIEHIDIGFDEGGDRIDGITIVPDEYTNEPVITYDEQPT